MGNDNINVQEHSDRISSERASIQYAVSTLQDRKLVSISYLAIRPIAGRNDITLYSPFPSGCVFTMNGRADVITSNIYLQQERVEFSGHNI